MKYCLSDLAHISVNLRHWSATLLMVLILPSMAMASTQAVTASGVVEGDDLEGVIRFLGIPYAQPPLGRMRWKAAQDAEPWAGVREAKAFGDACSQIGGFFASDDDSTFDERFGSEDCLYLNVWTPVADEHTRLQSPRPVLVFIHGGSGITGAASLPVYDGERLARELNAVVVTFNYRLGIFSMLRTVILDGRDPATKRGSLGLKDQVKALDWVRTNIDAFGGDPNEVTLMGHSAGSIFVWALMRSPLASGYFQRAVTLSGVPYDRKTMSIRKLRRKLYQDEKDDETTISDEEFDEALNQQSEEVRDNYVSDLTDEQVLSKTKTVAKLDSEALEDEDAVFVNAVPTLIGTVGNETSLIRIFDYSRLSTMEFWLLVNSLRNDLETTDFVRKYRQKAFFRKTEKLNQKEEVLMASLADELVQLGMPVYRYQFIWQNYPEPWSTLLGAYHAIDVPVLFGNFDIDRPNITRFTWTEDNAEEREVLHRELVTGLKGFIEAGDPNLYVESAGEPVWPQWDSRALFKTF
ncbi:carboxylesterase family protein [Gynuella sunshinyii]|uniref:Carboxylic ester hydrolase n=1 Tax=Gynuella sunshinyii YC6258 TaxID=1445510 RepID=A0A0C5VMN8_9GAMM|nr:carboxylesterase family protein [Gynuella sunshinyii]AJQ95992.1 carboxylesterase type B [Gynuella sunshinyii YC6258]